MSLTLIGNTKFFAVKVKKKNESRVKGGVKGRLRAVSRLLLNLEKAPRSTGAESGEATPKPVWITIAASPLSALVQVQVKGTLKAEANTKPGKKHERQNTNPLATKIIFLVEYATNLNEAEIPHIKYPIMEDQTACYRISKIYNVVPDR